jgi:ElaB/YqjD/DUF883 family membrane-anchored ribosome-binding protein
MSPERDPFFWSNVDERNALKARLMKISPTARNGREKSAWAAIEQEEKRDDRVAAATHVLIDRADKWGRKALSFNTTNITSKAGKLVNKQNELLKEAASEGAKRTQQAKAKAAKEMKRIQEELLQQEKAIEADVAAAQESVRTKFTPRLAEAATELKDVQDTIAQRVATFVEDIKGFSLDQLEMLVADRPVTVLAEGVDRLIAVPGTHKKERFLAGEV